MISKLVASFLIVFALFGICLSQSVSPSLSEKTTTTTTVSPTTSTSTTVAPPTPTPAPLPKSDELQFNITRDGIVCARFQFIAQIDVKTVINGTEQPGETIYLTNATKQGDSSCNENSTTLVLLINNIKDETLTFVLNHNESKYSLDKIEVNLNKNGTLSTNGILFSVDDGRSYLCLSNPTIHLNGTNEAKQTINAELSLKEFKLDAFRTDKDHGDFRQSMQCESDFPTNDFVPLAVGCALISLVFIVLIAYIVGRKRSRRLTYQSV